MPSYSVAKFGTDSSGRAVYMTAYMAAWWSELARRCHTKGFTPTIVQGAFMARAGGGAAASAGYHDQAGCLDLRTWDLTEAQVGYLVREARRMGAAAWVRDKARGGMDPHIHLVLGSDRPLASGAATQWGQYLAGRDGLASSGPDYHWRPDPLVTTWTPAPSLPDPGRDLTRGPDVDHAIADTRKAHRRAKGRRRGVLKTALDALRSLPTWPKR